MKHLWFVVLGIIKGISVIVIIVVIGPIALVYLCLRLLHIAGGGSERCNKLEDYIFNIFE